MDLSQKIIKLREVLHELINEKSSLLDKEVINASIELDNALNEYSSKEIK